MRKFHLLLIAAAAAALVAGCNNKKAPSAEQLKVDSLNVVKAQIEEVIAQKNAALKDAYATGDDAAIAAATAELLDLQAQEEAYDKAIAELEAEIEAAAQEIADDAAAEVGEVVDEALPEAAELKEELPAIEAAPAIAAAAEKAAEDVLVEKDDAGNEVLAYQLVETKPAFKGGDANSFSKWVGSHIEYPAEAQDAGIEGTSILKFRVNTDGKVSNVEVLRSSNPILDAEAVRVVSSSPKWTAGQQNGQAVPVSYVFPVVFKLQQ